VKEHANLNAPATIVEEESIEPSRRYYGRCVRSGHCRRHRISLIFFARIDKWPIQHPQSAF
jgi:hypothetical protein